MLEEEIKPVMTDTKKPKIAIGLGMEYRLGPNRTMNISTHVSQDDSIEEINKQADIIAGIAARQQAVVELDLYYDGIRIETNELNDLKKNLESVHIRYKDTKESLKKEWDKKHGEASQTFEDNWSTSGRKGEYKVQPQHKTALKNLDNSYEKRLSDLEINYQAETSQYKANIIKAEERLIDINRKIAKCEALVHGYKKPLKLVNEG